MSAVVYCFEHRILRFEFHIHLGFFQVCLAMTIEIQIHA